MLKENHIKIGDIHLMIISQEFNNYFFLSFYKLQARLIIIIFQFSISFMSLFHLFLYYIL